MISMMRRVLLSGLLAAAACGGGRQSEPQQPAPATASNDQVLTNTQPAAATPAEPAGPNARVVAKMQELSVAMCACKDADCAKRVSGEMSAWSQQEAQLQKEPLKLSEDEMKLVTEIGTRMGECMQRAMSAGNP